MAQFNKFSNTAFKEKIKIMTQIILLVGESGSGKTTIADLLEEMYGYKVLKSYTTRPPRLNDTSHVFITDKEFDKLKDIVAYTEYNGYRYCATADQVDNSDIYVIDPDGIEKLKNIYHGKKELVDVYLRVPEEIRASRMKKRGDSDTQIASRLDYDKKAFASYYPAFIVDNSQEELDIAIDKIVNIINLYKQEPAAE
mgnify:FL=1